MFIQINPSAPTPVYEQIVSQVKYAVASGELRPGDALPSVRQLAVDLLVNPNTVARAYRELVRDGVVDSRRGLGLFISPRAARACRRDRDAIVTGRIAQALEEAVRAQLSREEIEDIVRTELDRAFKNARAE